MCHFFFGHGYINNHLNIEGFNLHLTNHGNGKGVANYFKKDFKLTGEVNTNLFQMTKFSSDYCHVINIYRSQGAQTVSFIDNLKTLVGDNDCCYIVGDFNIDFLSNKTLHPIILWILSHGFVQLVQHATHESGSLLDYAFARSNKEHVVDRFHWTYYSDHAAVSIVENK